MSFKAAVTAAVAEYIVTCDVVELLGRLDEAAGMAPSPAGRGEPSSPAAVPSPEAARREVAKAAVYGAVTASGERERESLCALLSSLHVRGFLSTAEIETALTQYLLRLPELRLDHPRAVDAAAAAIAYLVQDDVIGDAFAQALGEGVREEEEELRAALQSVHDKALLVLDGPIPTAIAQLRSMYRDLVRRFYYDHDWEALARDVVSLNARHSLHELVRKVVQVALDGDDLRREVGSSLLCRLATSGVVPAAQVQEGFLRALRTLHETALDHPGAPAAVAAMIVRAIDDGALPRDFVDSIPPFLAPLAVAVAAGAGGDVPPPPAAPVLAKAPSSLGNPTAISPPSNKLGHATAVRTRDGRWKCSDATAAGTSGSAADYRAAPSAVTAARSLVSQSADARRATTHHGFPDSWTAAVAACTALAPALLAEAESAGAEEAASSAATKLGHLPPAMRSPLLAAVMEVGSSGGRAVEVAGGLLTHLWHTRVVAGSSAIAAMWRALSSALNASPQAGAAATRIMATLARRGVTRRGVGRRAPLRVRGRRGG